ncbi:MAG TPA: YncE family protein [Acidimicrobiales bacterium]|nr:YncE family protein [Acidimicrobiales bacterium]
MAAAIVVGIAAVTVGRSSGSHRVPASAPAPAPTSTTTTTLNVYANAAVGKFSPAVQGVPSRVYVPNSESDTVSVIDPTTFKIISTFPVPRRPQHVVPSWDLKTLYVNSDLGNALTPIDPRTGIPGPPIPVDDPYNLYFTPDGTKAIVVPEQLNSLDFRDPHTWQLIKRVPLPCQFPNHMDFTADGRSVVVSCEGSGQLVKVDVVDMVPTATLKVGPSPQDVRLSPDGSVFYVADQDIGGIEVIDAANLTQIAFIPTGRGTHGMYPSRDATQLYVSNRLAGTISVISYATRQIVATWPVPGGSPDMGGVSADGTELWLSGRYNSEIYVIDTASGALRRIPVGKGPHGLCVFPQPGRISLGHTGNYR